MASRSPPQDSVRRMLQRSDEQRVELFRSLDTDAQHAMLQVLPKHMRRELLAILHTEEMLRLLQHMDTDRAIAVLELVEPGRRVRLMEQLGEKMHSDLALLLKFDPDTAAGLMSMHYVQVQAADTIATVAKLVKMHERRTGKVPSILIQERGKLLGYLPGHALAMGQPSEIVRRYVRKIKTVPHHMDTEKIMEMFRRYPHNKMVVLGERGNVMGILYTDDILRAIRAKEASSLYDFAGLHKEETVYDSVGYKIRSRYKWLIINLGTAFLAASTVGLFDATISRYVLLAVYMPIVAGMGGNAATQTLAVMVRGLGLKQMTAATLWRTLRNELGAGLANGLINGAIITGIVIFKDGDVRIALILAVAMIANLLIAAFFGTLVPVMMKRLGKDPAASATIFITTATDVFGFLAFLGLATMVLR